MKTVNFIDAFNSSKKFKAIDIATSGHDLTKDFGTCYISSMNAMELLNEYSIAGMKEFFNARFELEEKTITITESQLSEAVVKIFGNLDLAHRRDCLKKELGF